MANRFGRVMVGDLPDGRGRRCTRARSPPGRSSVDQVDVDRVRLRLDLALQARGLRPGRIWTGPATWPSCWPRRMRRRGGTARPWRPPSSWSSSRSPWTRPSPCICPAAPRRRGPGSSGCNSRSRSGPRRGGRRPMRGHEADRALLDGHPLVGHLPRDGVALGEPGAVAAAEERRPRGGSGRPCGSRSSESDHGGESRGISQVLSAGPSRVARPGMRASGATRVPDGATPPGSAPGRPSRADRINTASALITSPPSRLPRAAVGDLVDGVLEEVDRAVGEERSSPRRGAGSRTPWRRRRTGSPAGLAFCQPLHRSSSCWGRRCWSSSRAGPSCRRGRHSGTRSCCRPPGSASPRRR